MIFHHSVKCRERRERNWWYIIHLRQSRWWHETKKKGKEYKRKTFWHLQRFWFHKNRIYERFDMLYIRYTFEGARGGWVVGWASKLSSEWRRNKKKLEIKLQSFLDWTYTLERVDREASLCRIEFEILFRITFSCFLS